MHKNLNKIIYSFIFAGLVFILIPATAQAFTPGYIISDAEFTNKDAMTETTIQKFLENKGSYLANYTVTGTDNSIKRASQVIYDAGQYYDINPRVLLVRLQVEQSLITSTNPSERTLRWATGYGICDSCSKEDPILQKYGGFYNQINWCAKQKRRYLDYPGNYNFQAGKTVTVDGQTFKLLNQATAALYNYTPHLHGNQNFKTLWDGWFDLAHYPDGSLLREAGTDGVYLISGGKKRPILSRAALYANYNPNTIIEVSRDVIDSYEDGEEIRYIENTLIRSPHGTVYMISNGKRRGFESSEALRQFGFNPEEIINVGWSDLNKLEEGDAITIRDSFPAGGLLQSVETGAVFYISSVGTVYPIWDRTIMESRFPNRRFIPMYQEDIDKFNHGDPLKFQEGAIVTSPGSVSVYVISNGRKLPFRSADAFNAFGYDWNNIVHTTDQVLELHPTGSYIDIE